MAMASFYKLLNRNSPNKKSLLTLTNTESVITQVQKPGDNNSTTPKAALTPKGTTPNSKSVNLLTKYIPSLVVSCLTRKREQNEAEGGYLLGKQNPTNRGRRTLVLDLDETLVHSSFEQVPNPDLTMSLYIKGTLYNFSVMVRPGVEEFLTKACEKFEVVIYTASLMEYATALMKLLHKADLKYKILAREHCTVDKGAYVKDLARLGRDLKDVILVDNSPNAFRFNPENAYHIKDFFDDKTDTELYTLMSWLDYMNDVTDVRPVKTHRLVHDSKINSQPSISTQSTLKSSNESTCAININLNGKSSQNTPRKNSSAGENEAASIIRSMIEKKKQMRTVRPDDVKTNLLNAKVRNTDVSTAGKSTEEGSEAGDDVMLRRPVRGNCDELDLKCQQEGESQFFNQRGSVDSMATGSRGSSGSLSDSVAEEKEINEKIYHAIEARAC